MQTATLRHELEDVVDAANELLTIMSLISFIVGVTAGWDSAAVLSTCRRPCCRRASTGTSRIDKRWRCALAVSPVRPRPTGMAAALFTNCRLRVHAAPSRRPRHLLLSHSSSPASVAASARARDRSGSLSRSITWSSSAPGVASTSPPPARPTRQPGRVLGSRLQTCHTSFA